VLRYVKIVLTGACLDAMDEIGTGGKRDVDDELAKDNGSSGSNGIDAKSGIERETTGDEEGVALATLGTADTSATKGDGVGTEAAKEGVRAAKRGRKGWWGRMNANSDGDALENIGSRDGLLTAGVEGGQTGEVVWKVYKRRWFGLLQLVLLNIVVSWDVSLQFTLC
jgi:hypothetical protein